MKTLRELNASFTETRELSTSIQRSPEGHELKINKIRGQNTLVRELMKTDTVIARLYGLQMQSSRCLGRHATQLPEK